MKAEGHLFLKTVHYWKDSATTEYDSKQRIYGVLARPDGTRAVASLTIPGGQDFHFPHFSSNFDQFLLFFLIYFSFSSSFWLSGWASRPPGKALTTPLDGTKWNQVRTRDKQLLKNWKSAMFTEVESWTLQRQNYLYVLWRNFIYNRYYTSLLRSNLTLELSFMKGVNGWIQQIPFYNNFAKRQSYVINYAIDTDPISHCFTYA